MSILSTFKHRIFLRIYAGLLVVCLAVVLFSQLLLDTINEERAQNYREEIATGVFYVVTEGISHQLDANQREYWLSDASSLFGSQFRVLPIKDVGFLGHELKRLEDNTSVVRYSNQHRLAYVYHKIPGESNVLSVKITRVNEQQIRAFAIFLLDDLSYYSSLTAKQDRLSELSKRFPFALQYKQISEVDIDEDQMGRLRRNEVVMMFRDGTSADQTSINVIVPSEVTNMVIEMGPLPLFNLFPLNLVLGVALLGMLLISLGVYALILPLERKLQLLQAGLNDVSEGKLDTRLKVYGEDETAKLSATFNAMAEHIKRLIESQRELTRAVSHELRTPVARIRFAVDMLADTDDEKSRQMQRDFIDDDIEALNSLIDEILTHAKLEEGSPRLNWELVDLKELVEQIVRETNALGKPIKILGELPNNKAMVQADRRYLHRVLQNLAGNALRYANSSIVVSAGIKKGNAFVSVEDDGQGIPEEDRAKVFIPFARLDDSRTRSSGGYGLGLSIVSRICFWFNGEMTVDESPELGGARFVMTWPIKQLTQAIVADELTQEHNERKIIDEL